MRPLCSCPFFVYFVILLFLFFFIVFFVCCLCCMFFNLLKLTHAVYLCNIFHFVVLCCFVFTTVASICYLKQIKLSLFVSSSWLLLFIKFFYYCCCCCNCCCCWLYCKTCSKFISLVLYVKIFPLFLLYCLLTVLLHYPTQGFRNFLKKFVLLFMNWGSWVSSPLNYL